MVSSSKPSFSGQNTVSFIILSLGLVAQSVEQRIEHPRPWFDSAPGHQESQKPSLLSGGFVLCGYCINNGLVLGSYRWGCRILLTVFGEFDVAED